MAVWHLRQLDAQDLEGPHLRQKGTLSPKRTHVPNGVFGAQRTPHHHPPYPHCCSNLLYNNHTKRAAMASARQSFFKAVEWGVVRAQWGLAKACMWALDLKLRATTANPCKSPSIMRGYHVPIARFQNGCAHVPSHFQEITRKLQGSKATHLQQTCRDGFVHT